MFEKEPSEKDPLKDPKITAITAVTLVVVSAIILAIIRSLTALLFSAATYLPITCSAMAIYVGVHGIRSALTAKATGFLCMSILGVLGGLFMLILTLFMFWKHSGYYLEWTSR